MHAHTMLANCQPLCETMWYYATNNNGLQCHSVAAASSEGPFYQLCREHHPTLNSSVQSMRRAGSWFMFILGGSSLCNAWVNFAGNCLLFSFSHCYLKGWVPKLSCVCAVCESRSMFCRTQSLLQSHDLGFQSLGGPGSTPPVGSK